MPKKIPQFFQNAEEKSSSEIRFSTHIIKTQPTIHDLYRGFDNLSSVIFGLPTLHIGIFGKTYPEVITHEEVRLHKLTNLSSDYHMVSMTESPQVASAWGQGCFVTIDPALFRHFTVDVHATSRTSGLNFPGRMEREKEHAALVVPYCSIKKITIKDKEMTNPFYLDISSSHQEAIEVFSEIYCKLVSLLRNKYMQQLGDEEEKLALQEYVAIYLQYYDQYSGADNPFNKTLQELVELYPEFMEYFFQLNPQQSRSGSMKDAAIIASDNIFKDHYYTQSLDTSSLHGPKVAITCYDDEWARPCYD